MLKIFGFGFLVFASFLLEFESFADSAVEKKCLKNVALCVTDRIRYYDYRFPRVNPPYDLIFPEGTVVGVQDGSLGGVDSVRIELDNGQRFEVELKEVKHVPMIPWSSPLWKASADPVGGYKTGDLVMFPQESMRPAKVKSFYKSFPFTENSIHDFIDASFEKDIGKAHLLPFFEIGKKNESDLSGKNIEIGEIVLSEFCFIPKGGRETLLQDVRVTGFWQNSSAFGYPRYLFQAELPNGKMGNCANPHRKYDSGGTNESGTRVGSTVLAWLGMYDEGREVLLSERRKVIGLYEDNRVRVNADIPTFHDVFTSYAEAISEPRFGFKANDKVREIGVEGSGTIVEMFQANFEMKVGQFQRRGLAIVKFRNGVKKFIFTAFLQKI